MAPHVPALQARSATSSFTSSGRRFEACPALSAPTRVTPRGSVQIDDETSDSTAARARISRCSATVNSLAITRGHGVKHGRVLLTASPPEPAAVGPPGLAHRRLAAGGHAAGRYRRARLAALGGGRDEGLRATRFDVAVLTAETEGAAPGARRTRRRRRRPRRRHRVRVDGFGRRRARGVAAPSLRRASWRRASPRGPHLTAVTRSSNLSKRLCRRIIRRRRPRLGPRASPTGRPPASHVPMCSVVANRGRCAPPGRSWWPAASDPPPLFCSRSPRSRPCGPPRGARAALLLQPDDVRVPAGFGVDDEAVERAVALLGVLLGDAYGGAAPISSSWPARSATMSPDSRPARGADSNTTSAGAGATPADPRGTSALIVPPPKFGSRANKRLAQLSACSMYPSKDQRHVNRPAPTARCSPPLPGFARRAGLE